MTDTAPLAGVRVVELASDVAAAYCARQFALWGADVVVLEPEGGSPLRRLQPVVTVTNGSEVSLLWTNIAANKRTLDLTTLAPDDLEKLLASADVFVTDYREADLKPFAGLEALTARHPALCVVSVTPFGLDGPYAGFAGAELVVQALSGYLGLNGLLGQPPLQAPGHLTGYAVGVAAFVGALAACYRRRATGRGDFVEVSAMECLAAIVPYLRVQYFGSDKVREGGTEAGVRILPCADGWVSFMPVSVRDREAIGAALSISAADWPAGLDAMEYGAKVRTATEFLSRYTKELPAEELFHRFARAGVTCGKVFTPAELLKVDQLAERGFFEQLNDAELGGVAFAGAPARVRNGAPVAPGSSKHVSLSDVGWTERRTRASAGIAMADRPLSGTRILDLTQAWIGPFATLLLADLGAEVIKIESHRRPDVWRQSGLAPETAANAGIPTVNRSHYFNSVNRSKLNLALDLQSAEGKALFLELVKSADVVAENYTARVMDRLGLGYEVLRQIKPALVMASSSGFGKTGPWSAYRTNGSAIEALAGWDALHRYSNGPPVLMGFYQADAICGLQFAAMMLVSLIQRAATGSGNFIDASMLEASVGYLGEHIMQASLGIEVQAQGNRSADMAPHGVYPCRGDDRWIAIAVTSDAAWRSLCGLLPAANDAGAPLFATLGGRLAHQDKLDQMIADWTKSQDADALMQLLQASGVAAGVVRGLTEGLSEPHLTARRWFKTLTRSDLGPYKYAGFLWRFRGCDLVMHLPPPRLGEHSDQLLRTLLALDDADVARLKEKDVTGAVM